MDTDISTAQPLVPNRLMGLLILVVALPALLSGCGKKPDAGEAQQLEQSFTSAAAALTNTAGVVPSPGEALARSAAEAMQKQDYATASAALNSLRFQTNLTGEQLRASQKAAATVYSQLVERAAKGDPQAKAALEQLKRMQDKY